MHYRSKGLVYVLVCCLMCAFTISLAAQVTTGDILGAVTDSSGAVVTGAHVTIKNLDTGATRTMETNAAGAYVFPLLPVGNYALVVEVAGFKKYAVDHIELSAGSATRSDARMEVGEVEQTVDVHAEAVGALQTDSATLSSLVSTKAVQELPLNGRNFVQLVQLQSGMNEGGLSSMSGGGRPDDRRQTSSMSANGQHESFNSFMIDGMDNYERNIGTMVVKPSVDAIQEVKVQTNSYSADVGRSGGAAVNMISKSGTNKIHGTLFEFLRNDKLDAMNFFNVPVAGNPYAGVRPEYRQNQFGGSAGGPIQKDKTFYFADYQGLRIVQGVFGQQLVPTACELGRAACNGVQQLGNFSDLSTPIYDITQAKPTQFPNNIIPRSRIPTITQNYAALYPTMPASACQGTSCMFSNNPIKTQAADVFDTRIDHTFNTNNTLFGRYSFNNTNTFLPGLLPKVDVAGVSVYPGGNSGSSGQGLDGYPGTSHQRSQNGAVNYTRVLSPTLVLQLRAGVTRYVSDSEGLNFGINASDAFGGPANANLAGNRATSGLTQTSVTGYAGVGDAAWMPTQYWDTTKQGNGDLNWSKGAHTLKFGGNLIRRLWNSYQSKYSRGYYAFGPQQTNSAAGGSGGTGGNGFASFLLGFQSQLQRNLNLVAPQYRAWEIGSYVMDDWRVTSRLTINVGLRYDIFTRFTEKNNHISTFDPTVPSVLAGGQMLIAGQNGVSSSIIPSEYRDFQPRIGLAYTARPGFVIRGGFGTSYAPSSLASTGSLLSFPFSVSQLTTTPTVAGAAPSTVFGTPLPPLMAVSACLAASCGTTGSGIAVPYASQLNIRNMASYQFNFTVEKEYKGNTLAVSYVGVRGRHLERAPNVDQPLPPQQGGCGVTTAIKVPSPCQPYYAQLPLVSSIQLLTDDGSSNYNALQANFNRRYKNGLSLGANYTYARGLANVGGPGGNFGGENIVPQWLWYDYGNSNYDVRHRLSVQANYELPFGKSLRGVAGGVIKDWQVNAILLLSTGLPFTVTNGSNPQQNTAITADRPNALPQGSFTKSINQWFNTAAFALQAYGTAGNEGANNYYGPGQKRLDFSLFKTFPITERIKLQFRAESFNLSNTPSFNAPTAAIAGWSAGVPTQAGSFGKITSTSPFYTPRQLQFALKLLF